MANVLVLGGGGREHSIVLHLSKSNKVKKLFVAPGNAGSLREIKCVNLSLPLNDGNVIGDWCEANLISLVVVGPEEPLIVGVSDILSQRGIACFGPSAAAARLEGSKHFGKEVMKECDISTAKYQSFDDVQTALNFLKTADVSMRIVKADGIAAGKGVIVAGNLAEAEAAVSEMLDKQNPKFGLESSKIIIEEELVGPEISILAFTDGVNVRFFPPSQDHKRVFDGDKGPNTGGMGAYCPCDLIDEDTFRSIEKNIVQKVVDYMKGAGTPYQGIIYVGLMITEEGPRVLEFNCRFGDPETQVLLPLLKTDLYEVMVACSVLDGMKGMEVEFYNDRYAMCLVMASGGYPGSFVKGFPISGIDQKHPCVDIIHAGTSVDGHSGQVVTSGGRVLGVVAVCDDLHQCQNMALAAAAAIDFKDRFYRKDIGYQAIHRTGKRSLTYASAGVSISAGDELVSFIKSVVGATNRPGTVSEIGQFGAVFDLNKCGYKEPLLVSGTDGVGTKLKIALEMNKHDTIGQDLVAMCVNDILCHGAEPMFFLDYFASGKLDLSIGRSVVSGITDACKLAGCSLIGGETAEMPGLYLNKDYDLAGFVVGAVEKSDLLPRLSDIKEGDCIIGIASSGLHSNGFSLVRKILSTFDLDFLSPCGDGTIGSVLLTPTIIYVKPILKLLKESKFGKSIRSLCHITGGGLPGNLPRSLPPNMKAVLESRLWQVPPVFRWLWGQSCCDLWDFANTFNLGIGMTIVVSADSASDICRFLSEECGLKTNVVGHVTRQEHVTDRRVVIRHLKESLDAASDFVVDQPSQKEKIRVGVLISGSGTNLRALLKYASDHPTCSYEIVLVVSNVENAGGLTIAKMYGVPTVVVNHKLFSSRSLFDCELERVLSSESVQCQLVCLAGFMRILGEEITNRWRGRMLNIHPSLLPSFKGAHAHRQVLSSGVTVTGATVHFVVPEVDSGGIVAQAVVNVLPGDSEASLAERVKNDIEHRIFPAAVDDVASGKCWLDGDNVVRWRRL